MQVSLFDFHLPDSAIADFPASPKESAKLLCVAKNGNLQDKHIYDLPDLLQSGDLLVFNNSKVIPARLYGKRDEIKIETLLHKRIGEQSTGDCQVWKCFARPAKRLKVGQTISFADDFSGEVMEKLESGEVILSFGYSQQEFHLFLEQYGQMPLPPYIKRDDGSLAEDKHNYQTCYAKAEGSVAAPTAGLHFTPELLQKFVGNGVETAFVTLHVGGGTFLPVKVDDTADHVMHSEFGSVCEQVASQVNKAKSEGRRVIAVGTTSLRLLESAAGDDGIVQPFYGETDIFITPSYKFKAIDAMITNFHLPKSTLFMLVCAMSGIENIKAAYAHAIENNYRFYSYGDACFLE